MRTLKRISKDLFEMSMVCSFIWMMLVPYLIMDFIGKI